MNRVQTRASSTREFPSSFSVSRTTHRSNSPLQLTTPTHRSNSPLQLTAPTHRSNSPLQLTVPPCVWSRRECYISRYETAQTCVKCQTTARTNMYDVRDYFFFQFQLTDAPRFLCDTPPEGQLGRSANITCVVKAHPVAYEVSWHFYYGGVLIKVAAGEATEGYQAIEGVSSHVFKTL